MSYGADPGALHDPAVPHASPEPVAPSAVQAQAARGSASAAEQQETTLLESPTSSPTTRPPPPAPFPEFGGLGSDDEEMTRMEQVPPEVLAQLMARAQAAEAPSGPPPAPPSGSYTDDEPTRLGLEIADLVAAAGPSMQPPAAGDPGRRPGHATQLGVPAITPKQPAAAPAPRNLATQLGVPAVPTGVRLGAIPAPPRPLSSIPPPPVEANAAPGLAAPTPGSGSGSGSGARRAMGGTLFGLQGSAEAARASAMPPAPVGPPAPLASVVPKQSAPPPALQPGQPAPRRVPNASPTLLGGVLPPAMAGANDSAPPPGAALMGAVPPNAPGAPWTPPPGHPLYTAAVAPNVPQQGPQEHFAPGQAPWLGPVVETATPNKRSGVPLVLVLLLLVGIVAGGAYFALRWHQGKAGAPITASIDAAGVDLELTCPSCPDGTRISLGPEKFVGGKTRVILPAPLEVGDRVLEATMQAPNQSATTVKIAVAVEFRLDVDTTTLRAYPPALTVRAKVRPGGTLTVAGKPATGDIVIPVGDAATGPRETVIKLPLDVAYHYERAGLPPHDGVLHQELNILPLRLFSPKDGTFTADSRVIIQGQAPPGIDVHVANVTLKPDEKGMFQVIRPLVVGANEIPLWLSRSEPGPGGVSRGITLRLTRSASTATLWAEAKAAFDEGQAGPELNALYRSPAGQVGKRFLFAGSIVEAQTQRGETIALIDGSPAAANLLPSDPMACKAASCLLRVIASGTARFAKGDKVRGIGRSVTPRDPKTPEVEAHLLVSLAESK